MKTVDAKVTVVWRIVASISKPQEPCFSTSALAEKRVNELLDAWDKEHEQSPEADKFFYRPQYSVVPDVAFVFDGMVFSAGYHSLGEVCDIVGG